jgi:hypothetical protein
MTVHIELWQRDGNQTVSATVDKRTTTSAPVNIPLIPGL